MENHNVVLWDANKGTSSPLRRPNASTTAAVQNRQSSSQASNTSKTLEETFDSSCNLKTDIVSTSKLSAEAKEWFPPDYKKNATSSTSVQSRLNKHKSKPEQESAQDNLQQGGLNSDSNHSYTEVMQDIARLQDIVNTLTGNPGQFDDLIGSFVETLGPYFESIDIISTAATLIIDQALYEQNFRYSAARLCCIIEEQCPLFRSTLHILCEKKLHEDPFKQGLTLFLAELYAQLHYDNLYGRCLLDSMRSLLSVGGPDNIKCICQALKLTGYSLESYNKPGLDDIFAQLDGVKASLPTSIGNLVQSVSALRTSQWGQSSPQITPNNSYQPGQDGYYWPSGDGPVFYGPDGKELTQEERQFLADNCEEQDIMPSDDSDPDGLWDPDPEMDEEIQAAFRQFVQLNKK